MVAASWAVSSHSIGSGKRTRAFFSTSSMPETGMISSEFLTESGMSARSLALSSGIMTSLMPPRRAASSFSFRPPIGRMRPRRVISPVMATSRRTGIPVMVEITAVAMAIPADGPSLGVAPSGTWT
ncbi:membrane-associated protein [Stappia aggregata IAM 12614]|uniref:Membrane-associated protein n=1 Tax=Roseibium aggregatum (strain ATCC 25650 / DSM 13394 / JCM 20685 / NBRC 16684 / NCIMB 2208 / IAM 12614 / B1) TaxID=384765 RepID=A0NT97_ROSAI|nr:membrane-associated protein [Stappia aggregata IAM 12614] [Roseibium aggregatum IAM 12614]